MNRQQDPYHDPGQPPEPEERDTHPSTEQLPQVNTDRINELADSTRHIQATLEEVAAKLPSSLSKKDLEDALYAAMQRSKEDERLARSDQQEDARKEKINVPISRKFFWRRASPWLLVALVVVFVALYVAPPAIADGYGAVYFVLLAALAVASYGIMRTHIHWKCKRISGTSTKITIHGAYAPFWLLFEEREYTIYLVKVTSIAEKPTLFEHFFMSADKHWYWPFYWPGTCSSLKLGIQEEEGDSSGSTVLHDMRYYQEFKAYVEDALETRK